MICLIGLVKKVNETLCEIWRKHNSTVYAALEECEPFFQFPTVPIHSDHVRLFYEDPRLKLNKDQFLFPDYICYNQQLCDFIIQDSAHEKHTCFNATEVMPERDNSKSPWAQLMLWIGKYFRSCSILHANFDNKTKYNEYPSLYNCQNSLKFMSKHRLLDGMQDCLENDDEDYPDSCQLNDKHRVTCINTTICWSPIVKGGACALNGLDDTREILFPSFCDGIDRYFYDNEEHSDEFGCGNWSCNNMYTRCDGIWTCADARDEYNCSRTKCPSETYTCISSANYTVICLPSILINDSIEHCLGGVDERTECQTAQTSRDSFLLFQCSDKSRCLHVSQVCDKQEDCSDDDENENLCKNQQFKCAQNSVHNRSEIEEYFCELGEVENRRIKYFSVHTSSNYPPSEKDITGEFNHSSTESCSMGNDNWSQVQNNTWPWYCNRGLVLYTSINNNSSNNRACICPPSYYGHRCEYQNQRISVSLRLTSNDRHATYAVVSMLMDDTDERQQIHAYDQFLYIAKHSCSMKLNRYLLFSSRPKNISHNYRPRSVFTFLIFS
jgi:hypothetical protein